MNILITGAEGFAGVHLVRHLLDSGVPAADIYGTYFQEPATDAGDLAIHWHQCDVTDHSFVEFLQDIAPRQIYHLAGQASVGYSYSAPEETITGNVNGALPLLQWIRTNPDIAPKALIISSAEIYADTGKIPRRETTELTCYNFYTLSKFCIDKLVRMYHEYYDIDVVCARAFNHTGPGQNIRFALPSFAKMIVELEKQGTGGTITTGNLEVWRDFTDVRDIVRAYRLLMEHGVAGEAYNICSGTMYKLEDLLATMRAAARVPVETNLSSEKVRKQNVERLIGDNAKLRALTGWEPDIDIRTTVADILEYWRNRD